MRWKLTADVLGYQRSCPGMNALTLAARQIDTGGRPACCLAGMLLSGADDALTSSGTIQGRNVTVSAADWLHNGVLLVACPRLSPDC
ncbi:hypothetical protein CWS02_19365 [Enterobacter sp. EA-1]|nr:hypothetical protein CWS02_19365 [Enterobacter sp. EA-1]